MGNKKPFPKFSQEFLGKCKCGTGTAPVRLVTYHGTQGPTARGGAQTLTTRTDGSAHEVHDAKEGFKLAADNRILCGVRDANTGNYHIEDATFANWSRKVWFMHRRQLKWSALRIAKALRRNGLPCHFITLKEANEATGVGNIKKGWTYHNILSLAPWCGSSHYDPAANAGIKWSLFPHKWFKRTVEFYFAHPNIDYPVPDRRIRKWDRKK